MYYENKLEKTARLDCSLEISFVDLSCKSTFLAVGDTVRTYLAPCDKMQQVFEIAPVDLFIRKDDLDFLSFLSVQVEEKHTKLQKSFFDRALEFTGSVKLDSFTHHLLRVDIFREDLYLGSNFTIIYPLESYPSNYIESLQNHKFSLD